MALQVINVGTTPNDGQGDAIRTAYIKCNDNFGELYSRAQTTPPVSLVGSSGDVAGMYAYDENFWYYCYADYDGITTIWAEVSQIGNVSVSSIQSGNSSIEFSDINGNAVVNIDGTANVAVFRSTGLHTSANVTALNVNATNFYGEIATAAQPNITSVGTLTDLSLSGELTSSANVSTTGNVIGGNLVTTSAIISSSVSSTGNITGDNLIGTTSITTPGTVSAAGNITTSGYFVGTFFGNVTGNFVIPGANTQVIFNSNGNADADGNLTFNKVTSVLQVTGNISVGNLLSTVTSASGNVTGGNLLTGGQVSGTGNITGGNVLTGGLISATGNITSAANISGGNLLVTTFVSAASHIGSMVSVSGNVTGGNVIGGGISAVSNITGGNLNVTTASASGNVTGGNLIATTFVSGISHIGSIVSVIANITGGNLLTSGLVSAASHIGSVVSVSANVTGGNLLTSGIVSAASHIGSIVSVSANVTGGNLLTGGLISATSNVTGGNLLTSGLISAASHIGSVVSVSANITGGNLITGGRVSSTGNITGGNLISTGTITTAGNIVNSGSNGVGNIGSSTTYFNTIFAKATSAQYADLAEKYIADAAYESGTVMVIGGDKEVTASSIDQDRAVAGVVSTNPAYIMNNGLEGNTVVTVALIGRVPCLVTGPVKKGALLVSTADGRARAEDNPRVGTVIGKALENFNGAQGTIEIVVGKL